MHYDLFELILINFRCILINIHKNISPAPKTSFRGGPKSKILWAQKEYNKKLRSKRVISEYTIDKMKKYEIMRSKFRNLYDTMTSIVENS